jgi:hypothetical protein
MSDNLANIADSNSTSLEAYNGEETESQTTSTLKNAGNLALSAFVAGCVGYTSVKIFEGASKKICKFLNKKADDKEAFDKAVDAKVREKLEEILAQQAQASEPEEHPQELENKE